MLRFEPKCTSKLKPNYIFQKLGKGDGVLPLIIDNKNLLRCGSYPSVELNGYLTRELLAIQQADRW